MKTLADISESRVLY